MNCDNKTGPVNIKHDSSTLTCDLTCNFMYKYNISGIIATNKRSYISLKLADGESQTVTYTSNSGVGSCSNFSSGGGNYNVEEIRIYSPSLHTYNGKNSDGEIIIYHNNIIGGKNLIVCIPISSSGNLTNNATTQLTTIINYMSKISNNNDGDIIQGLNFNLNDFIPNNYYYTYTATLPYYPCTNCVDYIVFDNTIGIINLSKNTLSNLKNIISNNNITTNNITSDHEFTYSKRKPNYGSPDPDKNIYIECNPTGSDGEVLVEENKDTIISGNSFVIPNINGYYNFLYGLLYIILLIIVIFGIIIIFKYLDKILNYKNSINKSISGGKKIGRNQISKSNLKL